MNFVSYNDAASLTDKIKDKLDEKLKAVSITQAEYDQLSTEEKNEETLYFITDGSGNSGGSGGMQASIYDPNNTVASAGGIVAYVNNVITNALTASY